MANTDAVNSGVDIKPENRVHFRNREGLEPIFRNNPDLREQQLPEWMFKDEQRPFHLSMIYNFKVSF